jgi:acetoin:2,6-dichlorophenolindophenol oxidoreductase subunit alpha
MQAAVDCSEDLARALYSRMLEIRYFEDEVQRLFFSGLVRATTHLCQGQEAVTVGACSVLEAADTMVCTYRGHGAVLARGVSPAAAFAELMGRSTGLCRGKGGSMHLMDVTAGAYGSFAIVGAGLPIANGLAWGARYASRDSVCVAFFGDGATNIGAFHEALNLAAVWRLPVIFICENNLYGEYSPMRATTPIDRLSDRAVSYGMPGEQVDGNDVLAVRSSVAAAVARARAGEGPALIEALTYRQGGHSRGDAGKYRPDEEVAAWTARDPIDLFARWVVAELRIDDGELAGLRDAAKRRIMAARDEAEAAPAASPDDLHTDLYTSTEVRSWAS